MTRNIWVLGNWKQNLLRTAAADLAAGVAAGLGDARRACGDDARLRVGIAPTYLALDAAGPHTGDHLWLLAQDVAAQESGAFTGEVGPAMLREVGVRAAIIGHSERRAHFGDHDALVAAKVKSALAGDLHAVLCVGETLEQRDAGNHETVVVDQLAAALREIPDCERVVIAYEPVWAIGTGRTATPEQASSMHGVIRRWLDQAGHGADRSILYGGSVKPGNAAELLAAGDIDGFLVGGASLDARGFLDIVTAAATHVAQQSSP